MDIRNNGKYLDLWSANHFLSGVVFAGWSFKFEDNAGLLFVIYIVIAIGWEFYELYTHVEEELGNRISDVALGVIGFVLVYSFSINSPALLGATALYVILEFYCYFDYKLRMRKGLLK